MVPPTRRKLEPIHSVLMARTGKMRQDRMQQAWRAPSTGRARPLRRYQARDAADDLPTPPFGGLFGVKLVGTGQPTRPGVRYPG
jgi:hypothetical protein